MSGYPLIVPKPQFFDQNGNPLTGGTLESYLDGGVTPAPLYSDGDATVEAGTSFELNARGEPQTSLFAKHGVTYTFVLKDALGATVWTVSGYRLGQTFPQTQAEIDAGVTPTDLTYESSPERYGAVGDGVTDDTTALQAWALVSDPRELLDKTYKCNDRLTFAKHAKVRGAGIGKSVLSFSGATGDFVGNRCVDFSQGSFVDLPALSGDVAEGDTQLPFAAAHNLSVGDIIFLHDATAGSWSGHLATYTKGEACIVAEVVSSTVVGLSAPLYDSYTSASTDAYRLDYGTVDIEGFSIEGVSNDSAVMDLFISHAAHVRIRNVKASISGLTATTIRYSVDVESQGFVSHQYHEGTESGVGQYGVSIIHCQDVRLNGHFQGERHAVTTGSTSGDGGIVNRGILVNGHLQSLIDCAADFHGNTEYSAYDGCVIRGGVVLGGDKNACRQSRVIGHADIRQGQPITFREMLGFSFDLSDIHAETLADPHSNGGVGVIDICGQDSTALTANTTRGGTLTIDNVTVNAPNANAGARFVNRGCTQDLHIRVNGLHLAIDAGTTAAFGLFRLDDISGGNFATIALYNMTGTAGLVRSKINFDVDEVIWEHEKGTFTPGVSFGGGVTGIAYTTQDGGYELIGNDVHWYANIVLSNKGSSTGAAKVTNLPFAVVADANYVAPAVVQGSNMTFADVLSAIHNQGEATVALQEVTNAGALTAITDADFTNTTRLRLSGTYRRAV